MWSLMAVASQDRFCCIFIVKPQTVLVTIPGNPSSGFWLYVVSVFMTGWEDAIVLLENDVPGVVEVLPGTATVAVINS